MTPSPTERRILSYFTTGGSTSPIRYYIAMILIGWLAAIVNVAGVVMLPLQALSLLFWLDVSIGLAISIGLLLMQPRLVHWAACVGFAMFLLGIAAGVLVYVAAASASV